MALQVDKSSNRLKCEYLINNRLMLVLVVHLPQAWCDIHDLMLPIASRKSCGGRNVGMPIAHVKNSRVETMRMQPSMCVPNSETASLQKVLARGTVSPHHRRLWKLLVIVRQRRSIRICLYNWRPTKGSSSIATPDLRLNTVPDYTCLLPALDS